MSIDASELLEALASNQLLLFLLVLTRIAPLAATAPLLGSRHVPVRVRWMLAVVLALMLAALHSAQPPAFSSASSLLGAFAREALLGLALGLAARVMFVGLQLAGQLIGQLAGMSLAEVFDPQSGHSTPLLAEFFHATAILVFLLAGGHRQMMRALLDSFRWRPPGEVDLDAAMLQTLAEVLGESFVIALRAGAPVVLALLVSLIVLGLVNRSLPQLNVFAVGLSVNSLVMLLALTVSLGAVAWLVEQQTDQMFDSLRDVWNATP